MHVFDSRSERCIKYALFAATQMTGFNPSSHDKLHEVQVLAGFSCLFNPSSTFQLSFSLSLSFSRHVTIERHLVNEVVAYVPHPGITPKRILNMPELALCSSLCAFSPGVCGPCVLVLETLVGIF